MTERPATTRLRCPKCRSRSLELTEVIEGCTTWEVTDGRLDFAVGILEPGGFIEMTAECAKCKHWWRPRGDVLSLIQVDRTPSAPVVTEA